MPQSHLVIDQPPEVWLVRKNDGKLLHATIVTQTQEGALFHFQNQDKRMDEWHPWADATRITPPEEQDDEDSDVDIDDGGAGAHSLANALNSSFDSSARATEHANAMDQDGDSPVQSSSRRRRGGRTRTEVTPTETQAPQPPPPGGTRRRPGTIPVSEREVRELGLVPGVIQGVNGADTRQAGRSGTQARVQELTEAEYDLKHHEQIYAQRNFDKVYFGDWEVKTWYFSPYPLTDIEEEELAENPAPNPRIPGIQKSSTRAHGRTLDQYIGGLQRLQSGPEKPSLWVCQQCFKYYASSSPYALHVRKCNTNYPPGLRVYQKGDVSIWEIDGAKSKLYCQNLSLFGKLFIDVKTLFFDCDNFLFYVLCQSSSNRDTMIGFFSKEKMSFDDYNLACIVTLPPHQHQGWGRLMIEFSYELSRRAGKVGTPERPLSDLGLRTYLSHWVGSLLRLFQNSLSVLPVGVESLETIGNFSALSISNGPHEPSEDSSSSLNGAESQTPTTNGHSLAHGHAHTPSIPNGSPSHTSGSVAPLSRRKSSHARGYIGEAAGNDQAPLINPAFSSLRKLRTETNADGSATTHVVIHCTLEDIAHACNLRPDDAAFAMNEVGLLMQRVGDVGADGEILITRELVNKVIQELGGLKPAILIHKHILLKEGQWTLSEV